MNIVQIIEKLEQAQPSGFQITKRTGCLSSTWLLYKRQSAFYFFDINQKIEFIDRCTLRFLFFEASDFFIQFFVWLCKLNLKLRTLGG
jgi:hypothetical protein